MASVTEKHVVAAAEVDGGDNPDAAPRSCESTVPCGAGECRCEDGGAGEEQHIAPATAAAERVMRFNVACAIVDLKWDTLELIKTHFGFDPARDNGDAPAPVAAAGGSDDGADDRDASAAAAGQPDGDFSDGELGHYPDDAAGREQNGVAYCGGEEEEEEEEEEKDEEEGDAFLREFRENYIKASGFDDRMKELDAIEEAYFDPDLDEETRMATIGSLWRHMEKELSDRARAVSKGKFKCSTSSLARQS